MGFGVQLDPYEFPPSESAWKIITSRLDDLHPAFLRVMFNASAYCTRVDEHGCAAYVWQSSKTQGNQYAQILRILDYAESRRIPVMIGEWSWPHLASDPGVQQIKEPSDPRWAEIIAPFLSHLLHDKHYTVLRYYNYMNEPNGGWMWPGGRAGVNYEQWKAGYLGARRVFDAARLHSIALVGPDNSGDWDWIDKAVADTAKETGGWEMHWYPTDSEVTSGSVYRLLAEKRQVVLHGDPAAASKPLYLGEAGLITGRVNGDQQPRVRTFLYGVRMADYAAQVAQAGWMGASAWDLDDAMHAVYPNHPAVPDALTLKTWGFWNSVGPEMGTPADFEIRPWFKVWSLLTHLFPPGSRILSVSDPAAANGIRAIASESHSGRRTRWSVLVVNDHDQASEAVLHLPQIAEGSWTLYRYSKDYCAWIPGGRNGVRAQVRQSRITLALPPNSAAFLSSVALP